MIEDEVDYGVLLVTLRKVLILIVLKVNGTLSNPLF